MPRTFDSFEQWMAQAPGLECRGITGHNWTGLDDKRTHFRKSRKTGRVTIEMECQNDDCGVLRTWHLGADGALEGHANRYDYPEGYLFKTTEKTAGSHVRKEHKAAIRAQLISDIPRGRIEWEDE